MPSINFKLLRNRFPCTPLLQAGCWPRTWGGEPAARGPCPVCDLHHPNSRDLWLSPFRWYCHKCRKGGDAIDLYALLHNCNVHQAARALCELHGIPVPYWNPRRGLVTEYTEQEEER